MKIVSMMVVGRGEGDRWLDLVLNQRRQLSDDIVVCGNNTDVKTEKIIKKYDCWFYRDDAEWGHNQPSIKTGLLKRVRGLKPDWIIATDADELFSQNFTREQAEILGHNTAIAYYFAIINLWQDTQHYRHDLSFWNIRYFKNDKKYGETYEPKPVHCGLAPPVFYNYGWHAPFFIKHYGLMNKSDRERKTKRYEKYDPNAKYKSKVYYDALKDNKGLIREFDELKMIERVKNDVKEHYKYESKKFA